MEIETELYSELPDSDLYHYTSLSGMQGIFRDKALRASDVRYLNDSAELSHALNLLRIGTGASSLRAARNPKLLEQFSDWLAGRIHTGPMVFVASFTPHGNLLSQWRGYCPPGKGVSLGLSSQHLLDCAARQNFRFGKCIYDNVKQRQIVMRVLESVLDFAEELGESSHRNPSQSFHDAFEKAEASILQVAALLKYPAFQEEEEWRAVSPSLSSYKEAPIKFREGHSTLIPYIDFGLVDPDKDALPCCRVYVGPTPHNHLAMDSISKFLSKQAGKFANTVIWSQIPYRTW